MQEESQVDVFLKTPVKTSWLMCSYVLKLLHHSHCHWSCDLNEWVFWKRAVRSQTESRWKIKLWWKGWIFFSPLTEEERIKWCSLGTSLSASCCFFVVFQLSEFCSIDLHRHVEKKKKITHTCQILIQNTGTTHTLLFYQWWVSTRYNILIFRFLWKWKDCCSSSAFTTNWTLFMIQFNDLCWKSLIDSVL